MNLTNGLKFTTSRLIYWNLPNGGEWRIPAGSKGQVKVNGKEVGFYFDGHQHPSGGPAPTIRKPDARVPTWMDPV